MCLVGILLFTAFQDGLHERFELESNPIARIGETVVQAHVHDGDASDPHQSRVQTYLNHFCLTARTCESPEKYVLGDQNTCQ